MSKKRILFYLSAIVLIAVVLRAPSLLVNFINIDENEMVLAGKALAEGGLPYRDYMIYQPPVSYYIYSGIIHFIASSELGNAMWWAHVITLIFVAATCIFIYLAASEAYGGAREGLFAALFFAVFSVTFLPQDMLATNHELFMILPMSVAVFCFLEGHFFVTGLFLGIAILTKYQSGILLPAFAVTLLLRRGLKGVLPLGTLVLGAASVAGLWAFYLYKSGVMPYALDCFRYILDYAKGPPGSDWLYVSLKFLLRTFLIGISGFGLWFFALKGCRHALRSPALIFVLWVAFGVLAILSGGRIYFHYYLVIYPPLAMLAGKTAVLFLDGLKKFAFEKVMWRISLFVLMFSVPAGGFLAYATYKPLRPKTPRDNWIYVVDYIRDRTKPKDPLLVWGYCPQIYAASNRPPATRFTTSDYLTGRSPKTAGLEYDPKTPHPPSVWTKLRRDFMTPREVIDYDTSANIFPGAWDLFMKDLEKNQPVMVVDTSPSNYRLYGRYPMRKFPRLEEYVKKNYVFEATIRGMDIYRRKK